jgi:hypothetical protein
MVESKIQGGEMNWIKVEEYIPDNNKINLVCDYISEIISLAKYQEDEDENGVFMVMNMIDIPIDYNVTHWMPLPEAPNEGGK